MARPGRRRKNPEMLWPHRETDAQFWVPLGLALLFAFLGLAGIAAGLLLRPVRAYAGLVRR